MSRLPWFLPAS